MTFCCRYKKLWDQDKDAYIRRYEKANKPLSSYELDIKEYLNKEVRQHGTTDIHTPGSTQHCRVLQCQHSWQLLK